MFVPRVILVFADCCVDEALRSAPGAVRIFLYRRTISMVVTTFDSDPSQLEIFLLRMFALADVLESATCSRTCSMSSPDAVLRSLQAVVLIFFLLMDPSLLSSMPVSCSARMTNLAMAGISNTCTLHVKMFDTLLHCPSSRSLFPPLASANLCAPPFEVRGPHDGFPSSE
ncbi:hypothetical protein CY34DRAFT_571744 [Suillus luteus UH-Slu-Lm8-n1]|uniref:Uncharacterized protein n=1 Tax=Suillus luteus UH-Slu-Lm8-n1 TaxID=930992 RepID=A0A0D0B518_9AGAM|nr:hypothetical protein CY34DRAFT_571744 [Suillus luteus UH-Slu-Lm8-n1]